MADTPRPARDQEPESDAVPLGRLAAWSVLALLLAAGLLFYFRYQPAIAPLYDKVN